MQFFLNFDAYHQTHFKNIKTTATLISCFELRKRYWERGVIGIILATDVILGSFHVFYIPENEDINEYKKSKIKPSTCLVLIIASLLLAILGIVLPLKIAIAIVVNAFFIILGLNVIRKIKEMF